MKKRKLICCILAAVTMLLCLLPAAYAEDSDYIIVDGPSSNNELAFGSVCILNGCRTIDSYVPVGGSDRRLDTALSAFAFERSTGTLVYAYNPDSQVSPGGLTKIVTALVVLEHADMDDVVTVNSRNISRLPAGTQNVNLKQDEQLTVGDLLHCLIMQGANDAAIALAEHVAGNQDAFVSLMNQRVLQMGCTSTLFSNVHGIDNTTQYTTARDMARIVAEATRNQTFVEIWSEISYTVPETNRSEARTFESQDYFVDSKNITKFYDSRVTGGMQAVSTASGASVVFTAEQNNLDMIYVVMGCTRQLYENGWQVKVYGNFEEGQDLLEYVFNNFKAKRILYYGQALKQFTLTGGECEVVGEPHIDLDSVLPSDAQMTNLIMEYTDVNLTAPVSAGDMIATVQVWYRNTCMLEAELYAASDVRTSVNSGLTVLGGANRNESESRFSRYVLIFCVVILVPAIGYLIINSMLRARQRTRMRRARRPGGGRRSV